MATDKTWFDEALKRNLFLDIGFRTAIWLAISLATLSHASTLYGPSSALAFKSALDHLLPVVNDVTRVTFVLCLAALILKDLEYVSPHRWGQQTRRGKLGGVARRLAGDLSTWILGALTALLASFLAVVATLYRETGVGTGAQAFIAVFSLFFLVAIPLFSIVNVWIRRDVSLVSSHARFVEIFNTPARVAGFYALLIAAVAASA